MVEVRLDRISLLNFSSKSMSWTYGGLVISISEGNTVCRSSKISCKSIFVEIFHVLDGHFYIKFCYARIFQYLPDLSKIFSHHYKYSLILFSKYFSQIKFLSTFTMVCHKSYTQKVKSLKRIKEKRKMKQLLKGNEGERW